MDHSDSTVKHSQIEMRYINAYAFHIRAPDDYKRKLKWWLNRLQKKQWLQASGSVLACCTLINSVLYSQ